MKRLAMVLAGLLLLGSLTANAQEGALVVKAGYNYASLALDQNVTVQDMINGRSGWLLGVGYQTEVAKGFSFQPEVVYKVTGYQLSDAADLRLGYLEVPLNVQWGPDLLIARPFLFAGPYFGFKVTNTVKGTVSETTANDVIDGLKKTEWGLGIGIGVNFFKFQIAGKYNWNFGRIADIADGGIPKTLQGKPRTFEMCVGIRF